MKSVLLAALLSLLLVDCHQKKEPMPDLFLGHWASESARIINYDATGNVTADQTSRVPSQLDITPTTATFSAPVPNGQTYVETDPYTRNGEVLLLISPIALPGTTYYVRSLTSTAFTLEFDGPRLTGQTYYVNMVSFHR